MQHMFKRLQLYPSYQKNAFFSITDIPLEFILKRNVVLGGVGCRVIKMHTMKLQQQWFDSVRHWRAELG